ncbi:cytosol aminopeptidase [Streptomyces cyaneofuscatus]
MTALTLSTAGAATLRADALVVGVAKGAKEPVLAPGAEAVDKAFDGKLATVLATLGAVGAEGELTKLPAPSGLKVPVVIAVGLGPVPDKEDAYDAEALRRAAGTAARALSGFKKAGFALPAGSVEDAAAVAEGALLGAYAFTAYQGGENKLAPKDAKAKDNGPKLPLAEITLVGAKPRDKAYKAAVERALALAEEINRARDLINTPPNDLYPESFAAVATAAGKEHGIKVAGARREGPGQGRLRRHPRRRPGLGERPAPGEARRTPTRRRRRPWPSWARASPTTRAASRSSRPATTRR